jgi:hypothetical protein
MPTKTMIHKGTREITAPAKTELVEVPDPDGGEGAVKLEEQVIEPERSEKVKLPPGTRFGDYLVNVPYEVSDAAEQKSLVARGFEYVTRDQAKKLDAKAEKEEVQLPHRQNDRVAEEQREVANENREVFDGNKGFQRSETKGGK